MAAYRTVMVELDAFDLEVLIGHARERVNESSKLVKKCERDGLGDSITACLARESLFNWKTTLNRLSRGKQEIQRQQREARKQKPVDYSLTA